MLPRDHHLDIMMLDFTSLSPREREEVARAAVRRAHAERAAMMDAVFSAVPRLIYHVFIRLTARKPARPAMIRRKEIVQV